MFPYNGCMEAKRLKEKDFEAIWEFQDPKHQFHCFIALHHLGLGPALGGVRIQSYEKPQEALAEVLRLARQMTYKAALAELPFGGGKAVIILPKGTHDRRNILHCFGAAIESLKGQYITAKDVGSSAEDMATIGEISEYVTGQPLEQGGHGDPSPLTAYGVYRGIEVARAFLGDRRGWKEYAVAIQGLGGVGSHLAQELSRQGVRVWASEVNSQRLGQVRQAWHLNAVANESIYDLPVDCFSPCALGQVINDQTLSRLKCSLVAGGANDQLADESRHAKSLAERNILYAPDFAINAGGLIHVAYERLKKPPNEARSKVHDMAKSLLEIFEEARSSQQNTLAAALRIAQSKLPKP